MTATPTPSPTPVWSGGGQLAGGSSGGGSRGFGDVWYTPTPLPIMDATPYIQVTLSIRTLPNEAVQAYNSLNYNNRLDFVYFIVIFFLVIGGFVTIIKRLENL